MSDVRIIGPGENLIAVVAEHLSKNYSDNLVLFPGRRPAHFLNKYLAEEEQKSFFPPKMFSIDDFVEFVLSEKLGVHTKQLTSFDAVAILYDVHAEAKPNIGGTSYKSLDAFFPVGVKLVGELEEIMLAEVSAYNVREKLQSVPYPKFQSLHYYYQKFYEQVERRGFMTRAMQYRSVADAMDRVAWDSFEKIVVAGFYAFTNVERRIIKYLKDLDCGSLIFQDGIGLQKQLTKLDIDEQEIRRGGSGPHREPEIHFYRAPDTHGQIFGLAARLQGKKLLDQKSVVVLPSPESLFPVIHGALSLVPPEDYNISLGYPLSRTPVFGFFNSLMDLAEHSYRGKFSPVSYVQFILHPYTKNIRYGARSDVTRIIAHRIEEYVGKGKLGMLFSLEELETDNALAGKVVPLLQGEDASVTADDVLNHLKHIHDNTIRKFRQFSSVKDCAQKAIEVLTYIFERSTAKLHPYFQPYASECLDVLDGISLSLFGEKSFDDTGGYFAFLRHALSGVTVRFSGTPVKGLQVLGLLETRNLQFDTVYVLDATDDVLPGRRQADVLLPQGVRELLGLETYRERDLLVEYYFSLAVQGAKEVHVFTTESDERQKEKSRFVEKLLWNKQRKAKSVVPDEFVSDVRYRVNLGNPVTPPVKKTPAMAEYLRTRNHFSTTQLTTYLKCQLQFYYGTVLNLREREEVTDEVDVMAVGSLVHKILRDLFAPAIGQRLTREHLAEQRVREVVDRCFEREYGKELIGPPYFIKQQVLVQLRNFVTQYQLPKIEREEVVIRDLEWKTTLQKNGYTFSGKIDRVEEKAGASIIIDYKTGNEDKWTNIRIDKLDPGDRSTWGEAIGSFQLPMYMMLYSEATATPLEQIVPMFLFLGRNRLDDTIEAPLPENVLGVYRAVEDVMFKLLKEIIDPTKDFIATDEKDVHCPTCAFNVICGTQWSTTRRVIDS